MKTKKIMYGIHMVTMVSYDERETIAKIYNRKTNETFIAYINENGVIHEQTEGIKTNLKALHRVMAEWDKNNISEVAWYDWYDWWRDFSVYNNVFTFISIFAVQISI